MAFSKDELGKILKDDSDSKKIILSEIEKAGDKMDLGLKNILPFGLGIHHAGLNRLDRNLVEDLFADKHI